MLLPYFLGLCSTLDTCFHSLTSQLQQVLWLESQMGNALVTE